MDQHRVGQIQISKIFQPNIVDRIKRQVSTTYVRLKLGKINPVKNFLLFNRL